MIGEELVAAAISNQEKGQDNHLEESVEDVQKHHNKDAGERELAEDDDEINPGKKDGYGTNLPLPPQGAEARCEEHPGKDDGQGK